MVCNFDVKPQKRSHDQRVDAADHYHYEQIELTIMVRKSGRLHMSFPINQLSLVTIHIFRLSHVHNYETSLLRQLLLTSATTN